jgi:hypothetical protein
MWELSMVHSSYFADHSCMEMSGAVQGWGQALMADPDTIRRDVVIIGKDHPPQALC